MDSAICHQQLSCPPQKNLLSSSSSLLKILGWGQAWWGQLEGGWLVVLQKDDLPSSEVTSQEDDAWRWSEKQNDVTDRLEQLVAVTVVGWPVKGTRTFLVFKLFFNTLFLV